MKRKLQQASMLLIIFSVLTYLNINNINSFKASFTAFAICNINSTENAFIVKPIINLPKENYESKLTKQSGCVKYPSVESLKFNNIVWQVLETEMETYYLYGAYFDTRLRNKDGPRIRVLTMISSERSSATLFCHIWFKDKVVSVKIEERVTSTWIYKVS